MLGHVYEWTTDWYAEYPATSGAAPRLDPWGPAATTGGKRIGRGGSFRREASRARPAHRAWGIPGGENQGQGFRVVLPGQ